MRRLAKWLFYTILVLIILTVILFVLLPAVFASSLAVVYSGSMAPAMPVGALAVMEPVVDPAEIKVGDIIAYNPPWDPTVIVSHRVIEVVDGETLGFRTKGDANEDPDVAIMPATNVVALVTFNVPYLGRFLLRIRNYTKSQLGFVLFVVLPTVLLIGSAGRDMNSALSPGKRRARQRKKLMERRKKRRFH